MVNGSGTSQFDGLFFALNERSQVVKFCLTKTESLKELDVVFQSAQELSKIEVIFTDNCCHDRQNFTTVTKLKIFYENEISSHRSVDGICSLESVNELTFRSSGPMFTK